MDNVTNPKILKTTKPWMFSHLKASSNYTILYTKDGKKLISGYSLKVFEKIFEKQVFVRIDRSNLVNKNFISGIKRKAKGDYVCLRNRQEILIPRRKHEEVRNAFPNFFKD